jgi:hypothetical protein
MEMVNRLKLGPMVEGKMVVVVTEGVMLVMVNGLEAGVDVVDKVGAGGGDGDVEHGGRVQLVLRQDQDPHQNQDQHQDQHDATNPNKLDPVRHPLPSNVAVTSLQRNGR